MVSRMRVAKSWDGGGGDARFRNSLRQGVEGKWFPWLEQMAVSQDTLVGKWGNERGDRRKSSLSTL